MEIYVRLVKSLEKKEKSKVSEELEKVEMRNGQTVWPLSELSETAGLKSVSASGTG